MGFKVDQGTKNNSLCNSIAGFARVGGNWCDGSVLHSQLKLLSYQGKIRTKVYLLCSFEDLSVLKKNSFTLPHLIITGVHILFLASFTLQLSKLKKSQQKLPIRLRLPFFSLIPCLYAGLIYSWGEFASKGLTRQIYDDKNYINLFFPQGRKAPNQRQNV